MILVTGSTGLLGSHLILKLVKAGYPVNALKRETSSPGEIMKLLPFYQIKEEEFSTLVTWVNGDVLDPFSLSDALEGVTKVYHCAGFVSFNPGDKKRLFLINQKGTKNLMDACLENQIEKLCHVSSIATIGGDEDIRDEKHLLNPPKKSSYYAKSKYSGELEVWRAIEEGLNAVIVNPSVILGPWNWDKSSAAIFRILYKGLSYYPEGGTGFVDVRDVADIMIKLMDSDISGQRFIINSENVLYKDIFQWIAEGFRKKPPSKRITPAMAEMIWRLEWFRSKITGSAPQITKNSIRSSFTFDHLSNEKIIETTNHQFLPVKDSVKETCDYFRQMYRL